MSASRIFCPSCGAENKAVDRFCISCGARLPVAQPPAPPQVLPEPEYGRAVRRGSNLPLLVTMGAVFVLLILIVVEAVVIFMSPGAAQEMGATLSVLEGNIFVQEGGEGNWMEVADDFVVTAGDRIRVGGGSQALLTFLEDTTTELRAFTELTVSDLQLAEGQPVVIDLYLAMGEIWNRIGDLPQSSLHEVTTAAARMVAHGSEYGAAVGEGDTTWLTGHDGAIDVTAGGQTVRLLPGDMLVVEPGSPPEYYQEAVVALEEGEEEEEEEPEVPVACNLDSIDLSSFANRPLVQEYVEPVETPSHTPTATREPTSTPTATSTATPTATATRMPCPTLSINVPSNCYPRRACGLEWDSSGPIPAGYEFRIEYSADQINWTGLPVPLDPYWYQEGGHFKAVIHGPGEGTWYWHICLVNAADPSGPSECCGPSHAIIHARDEEPEEEDSYDYDY
jgi:hypothetical protein